MTDAERIADLERRIAELERNAGAHIPWPQQPDKTCAQCHICGLKWDGPMGCVCFNQNCPSRITYTA